MLYFRLLHFYDWHGSFYQILLPFLKVRLWAPQLAFTNALGPFQVCLQLTQPSVKRSQLRSANISKLPDCSG